MTTPAPTYLQIRERLLHLKPSELGLSPTTAYPEVWGVMAELGYEVGSATLTALADGTTSLYYSTGGGLLGRGDYPPVAIASKALVAEAQKHFSHMVSTQEFPLPLAGQVRFFLLTYSGIYAADALESSLASGEHLLSPVYARLQDALDQMRLQAERMRS